MRDLIEALQIFLKYGNPDYPTHCEPNVLMICGVNPEDVSREDKTKLETLGFLVREEFSENFISYRFGST